MKCVKVDIMTPGYDAHNKSARDTKFGFLNPVYDRLFRPVLFMWETANQIRARVDRPLHPEPWWSKL